LVGDDLQGHPVPAYPFLEYGFRHCFGFFVVQGSQLNVFGEGVGDA
jgi:hypothetical protein